MEELNGKQKRYLRSLGHSLKPLLQVGKEGITEPFIAQVAQALEQHELIKIKVLENSPVDKKEAAVMITQQLPCHLAQIIGKTLLLFQSRKENPELILP